MSSVAPPPHPLGNSGARPRAPPCPSSPLFTSSRPSSPLSAYTLAPPHPSHPPCPLCTSVCASGSDLSHRTSFSIFPASSPASPPPLPTLTRRACVCMGQWTIRPRTLSAEFSLMQARHFRFLCGGEHGAGRGKGSGQGCRPTRVEAGGCLRWGPAPLVVLEQRGEGSCGPAGSRRSPRGDWEIWGSVRVWAGLFPQMGSPRLTSTSNHFAALLYLFACS